MALCCKSSFGTRRNIDFIFTARSFASHVPKPNYIDEVFNKLDLKSAKKETARKSKGGQFEIETGPPRYKQMPVDQHWPSVWPAAASFRPSVVPLPLHQGYRPNMASPDKTGNLELVKIPNFLHLTPPAIKAHCAAIKKFCTAWPSALKNSESFPVEIITSDYCHAGPSIRDNKSRIVTLTIELSRLQLEPRARDKMIRLLGKHYDEQSDMITLVADRCPMRKQNLDYLHYLLKALYFESLKKEAWEDELCELDWLHFSWDGSQAQKRLLAVFKTTDPELNEESLLQQKPVKDFGQALTNLINEGESKETVDEYKRCIVPLLKLGPFPQQNV